MNVEGFKFSPWTGATTVKKSLSAKIKMEPRKVFSKLHYCFTHFLPERVNATESSLQTKKKKKKLRKIIQKEKSTVAVRETSLVSGYMMDNR